MRAYRVRLALGVLALACVGASPSRAGNEPPAAYVWPSKPADEILKKAEAMGGERGLVVLARRCVLEIRSYNTIGPGVTREEYVRLLVTSDDGARNAKIPIGDQNQASIEQLEGRTIAPDGTITPVDEKKDVVRVSVSAPRSRVTSVDLATVGFPACVKGAILDLHFITKTRGPTTFYYRSLLFERLPALSTDFDVTLLGGLPAVGWSVMTLGETFGAVSSEYKAAGRVATHMGSYRPPDPEPLGLPSYHWEPIVLCYLNLATLHGQTLPKGQHRSATLETSGRGLVKQIDFSDEIERNYWRSVLDDYLKVHDRYVKDPGPAKKIEVDTIAPRELSTEERVRRLYGWVQEHVAFDPDAEGIEGVGDVVKKGMNRHWQATMVLSYLLERAGIGRQAGLVLDRYGLRFSPVLFNEYLFPANFVLKVDVTGKPPLFLSAGMPALPSGAMPDVYEEGIVLLPSGEKGITSTFTPPNAPGVDLKRYGYSLDLSASGDASGTVSLDEAGAPATDFALWNRSHAFRDAHPKKDASKSDAAIRERDAGMEKTLKEELVVPGDKLLLDAWKIVAAPVVADDPVKLSASAHAKGLAQKAEERWLLYAHPLLAGYTSPFTKKTRMQPVWHPSGGRIVFEGEIKLPPGATIVELPKPTTIDGPENTHATSSVTQLERSGALYLKSRVEYDKPYIVSRESYGAWMTFQASLASLASERCIITLPETKELE